MPNLSAQDLGLKSIGKIQHNLSYDELFEQEKKNSEGAISENGTMMVDTGHIVCPPHTLSPAWSSRYNFHIVSIQIDRFDLPILF